MREHKMRYELYTERSRRLTLIRTIHTSLYAACGNDRIVLAVSCLPSGLESRLLFRIRLSRIHRVFYGFEPLCSERSGYKEGRKNH